MYKVFTHFGNSNGEAMSEPAKTRTAKTNIMVNALFMAALAKKIFCQTNETPRVSKSQLFIRLQNFESLRLIFVPNFFNGLNQSFPSRFIFLTLLCLVSTL
jgi:hypothetical protein